MNPDFREIVAKLKTVIGNLVSEVDSEHQSNLSFSNTEWPPSDEDLYPMGMKAEPFFALLETLSEAENPDAVPPKTGRRIYEWLKGMETGENLEDLRYSEHFEARFQSAIGFYQQLADIFEWKPYVFEDRARRAKSIELKNFLNFSENRFEFSPGLNVLYGENGTGKTHLLKCLYACLRANEAGDMEEARNLSRGEMGFLHLDRLLNRTIQAPRSRLIRFDAIDGEASVKFETQGESTWQFTIHNGEGWSSEQKLFPRMDWFNEACFIPSKEVVSMFPSLIRLMESDQLFMDETYLHLARLLIQPPNPRLVPAETREVTKKIETLTGGKMFHDETQNKMFVQKGPEGPIIGAQNEAEGLRKLLSLALLLENGSIRPGSVLLWDEPESNLNDRLLRELVDVLIDLNQLNIQIFLATHNTFLAHCLAVEKLQGRKFDSKLFNLYFEEGEVRCESGEGLGDLSKVATIDESVRILDDKSRAFWEKPK